jgi:molecular chaperone DnaK
MDMAKVVGIDLGTTFSAIAVVNKHGKPEIIANREGERITPSVVLFDGDTPIVGSMAKRSAVASPDNVVQFVKRQMGNPSWKFPTESGHVYTPEEVSAIIIKRMKEDAETMLGETVRDAVITVPAYFDDAQRKATQDAGRIAGLNVLRIINEPTAAALAYGIDKIDEKQTILVYDLGGGTFDVTIMRLGGGGIEVVATGGNRNLGGFDWDNEIMNFLNEEFKKQGGSDLFDNPTLQQDLRDKAEIAKKTLSSREKTSVFLSAGGKNCSIALTLSDFERITEPLIKKTASIMEFVLEDANLKWNDIDKVLLVGGSTRMKAVPAQVEKTTGKKPSMEVHPDEVVAMGAALQGILLQIEEGSADLVERESFPLVEINDVCAHSMGVVTHDEIGRPSNTIVLKKNTPYGTKVSDVFATLSDRQTALDMQVTEGEDQNVKYVKIIGKQEIPIPPYPKGAPVQVSFEYNASGMVQLTVIDLTANKQLKEFHIKRESNLSERQIEEKTIKISKVATN